MKKLVLVLGLFWAIGGRGQDTVYTYTYGGESDDVCERILPTGSGYLLLGNTASFGYGSTDIYLVETDKDFNVVKSKTIGSWDLDKMTDAQRYQGGYAICGHTNTEIIGSYTGKIWVLNDQLEVEMEATLDYGPYTFPEKIIVHDQHLYVGGRSGVGQGKYFITKLSPSLEEEFKREYSYSEIGRIDSWLWNDENIVATNLSGLGTADSVGNITVIDQSGNIILNFELPDSVGIARDISLLHDSNYLVVGDKIDTAIADSNRYAAISKINSDLNDVFWQSRFSFVEDFYLFGVKGLKIDSGKLSLIAVTNYQFSAEGLSIVVVEYDSNGIFLPDNGAYYGSIKMDDIASDALHIGADTVIIAGSTNGFGAGVKDFQLIVLPRRSPNNTNVVSTHSDTLNKTLTIDSELLIPHENQCLQSALYDLFYTSQECAFNTIIIYDLNGKTIKELSAVDSFDLRVLRAGPYIVCAEGTTCIKIVIP